MIGSARVIPCLKYLRNVALASFLDQVSWQPQPKEGKNIEIKFYSLMMGIKRILEFQAHYVRSHSSAPRREPICNLC